MSRVGKNTIPIPDKVNVKLQDGMITVTGPKGELDFRPHKDMKITMENNSITVNRPSNNRHHRALHGTTRQLINNLILGISEGFTKELEINGVGYRAAVEGKDLVLSLGFSHPVRYPIPDGVTMKCERPTAISIHGGDKQKLGQLAAEISAYRRPEPFKGKGIKYAGENIRRKEGKKK